MQLQFYYCEDCGNLVIMLKNSGVPVVCCGQKMIELTPGMTEGSKEKHSPVCRVEGQQVRISVGAVTHPMEEEHFIEWIVLETKEGVQYTSLKSGDAAEASFSLKEGDEVKAVYAYCNLHGLWKA